MSEAKKSCGFRTSIGGQALIEGVMMRGPEKQAIVVRDQEGNLVEKVEDLRGIFVFRFADGQAHIICSIRSGPSKSRHSVRSRKRHSCR